ncbi:MAG: hypothetical protein KY458_06110 [Actinobacteria bacterium]|nr:hypothetical protein [Actinomycetota bacterium]
MIGRVLRRALVALVFRNRAAVIDWTAFGLRTAGSALAGRGTADARAELALRKRLRRRRRTRRALVEVRVERGVATIGGRLTPEVHAAVQDAVVRTPGIERVQDEVTHIPGRGRRRKVAATVA